MAWHQGYGTDVKHSELNQHFHNFLYATCFYKSSVRYRHYKELILKYSILFALQIITFGLST